jgi:hypothetical protein
MFKEAPNVNKNHLPNHVTGNRPVNTLETKSTRSLKVSLDRV